MPMRTRPVCPGSALRRRTLATAALDEAEDLLRIRGLDQVAIESRRMRSLAIGVLAPARERDDERLLAARQRPDAPRGFDAVHAWHAEIQHDGVRMPFTGLSYGFDPVARRPHLMALQSQQLGQGAGRVEIVVGDHHAPGSGDGRRSIYPALGRRNGPLDERQ